ncbi:hypothetical protein [Mycobacterium branderi]|uniref:Secreted protein n=1 Tax=Mycobacterium branderi TaxID=43348 RepID=A0A7I7WC08_9MYCO|nr:hypothetical protein [Mycobacterium branderi]MCV7235243.1 hypothetical protein [Mycobacterium branderi]ORA31884.1 hypothetical protein BST20_26210 [Mycobacterium branderi]BBZ15014.1 hypothetical protein MBRA_52090 [Mycobacterium branderi]
MGVVTAAAALAVVSVAVADANPRQPPPQFPNIDAYPAVNLSAYEHRGTHPGNSGWFFKAPNGITCAVSMLDDIGATCWGAAVGPPPQSEVNASSLQPGKYSASDPDWNPDATLLSVGTRLDNTNGVACAVISDDSIACRVAPNKGIDLSRPENSRYGVHGFVIQPAGNWTF